MLRRTPDSDRLYRLTHKQTGAVVALRHVGTSIGDAGQRIYWLCLPDDPMQCLMPMSDAEMRQYDGVKLTYWGKCADQTSQLKHWFSAPGEGAGPRVMTEPSLSPSQHSPPAHRPGRHCELTASPSRTPLAIRGI